MEMVYQTTITVNTKANGFWWIIIELHFLYSEQTVWKMRILTKVQKKLLIIFYEDLHRQGIHHSVIGIKI